MQGPVQQSPVVVLASDLKFRILVVEFEEIGINPYRPFHEIPKEGPKLIPPKSINPLSFHFTLSTGSIDEIDGHILDHKIIIT